MANSGNKHKTDFPLVIGQSDIKERLSKIIDSGRLAHAYLFTGIEGSGRQAMALELARILNCTRSDPLTSREGCDCHSCNNILLWRHPNLYPIFPLPRFDKEDGEAAQKALQDILSVKSKDIYAQVKFPDTGRILIDQIRELRTKLSLTMDRPGVRTIIVYPADRLGDEAANAFLKLLEEPPDNCCIILVSESTHKLLPTIVSRCQLVKFPPLAAVDIVTGLTQNRDIPKETAETAARLAAGSFTRALILTNAETTGKLEDSLEFLRAAATGNAVKITSVVNEWSTLGKRSDTVEMLDYTALWIKDALTWIAFCESEANQHISIPKKEEVIKRLATRYTPDQLQYVWRVVEESRTAIDDNSNVPLALTTLALRINRILT